MQPVIISTLLWLTLANPIDIARQDELVVVPLSAFGGRGAASLVVRQGDKVLPSQVQDTDFDGKVDSIAFLANFGAKESLKVGIIMGKFRGSKAVGTYAEISVLSERPEAKSGGVEVADGKFVSKSELVRDAGHKIHDGWYRFEGPLIESERIGYRFYWDQRGAIDVFAKVSDVLVGDAHRGNHHTMQAWGRDVLHNGDALGAGGLGIGVDAERFSPAGADDAKIVIGSNGPIRASYRMIYNGVEYKGKKYDLTWDISMSAGSRFMTHEVKVVKGGELEMLAGLTNHSDEAGVTKKHSLKQQGQLNWVGTFGRQVAVDSDGEKAAKSKEQMGLGLLWEHDRMAKFEAGDLEFDVIFKAAEGVKYYSLAAYNGEKEGAIKSSEEFYSYMDKLAKCLANPIIVKVEKSK